MDEGGAAMTTRDQIKKRLVPFVKPDDLEQLTECLNNYFFQEVVFRAADIRTEIKQALKEQYETAIDKMIPTDPDA